MKINTIIQGSVPESLKEIPSETIDMCVTSPPYWGLRDYGIDGQLGLEKTPEEYVAKLVEIFREIKRVLKKQGTVWLNLGDSYWGSGGSTGHTSETKNLGRKTFEYGAYPTLINTSTKRPDLKPKDLVGIPWRVAFALQADGWYLRSDIIWAKKNPMPESVTDRPTKSHEYIFLLSKSQKYFYDADAIREPVSDVSLKRAEYSWNCDRPSTKNASMGGEGIHVDKMGSRFVDPLGRNKRSVWTVSTKPFKDAHFAVFPESLIEPMVKAGCPEYVCKKCGKPREKIRETKTTYDESKYDRKGDGIILGRKKNPHGGLSSNWGPPNTTITGLTDCGCNAGFDSGIILDPFMGSGTTALVARKLNRNFIGVELNPAYIEIAKKRLSDNPSMNDWW